MTNIRYAYVLHKIYNIPPEKCKGLQDFSFLAKQQHPGPKPRGHYIIGPPADSQTQGQPNPEHLAYKQKDAMDPR